MPGGMPGGGGGSSNDNTGRARHGRSSWSGYSYEEHNEHDDGSSGGDQGNDAMPRSRQRRKQRQRAKAREDIASWAAASAAGARKSTRAWRPTGKDAETPELPAEAEDSWPSRGAADGADASASKGRARQGRSSWSEQKGDGHSEHGDVGYDEGAEGKSLVQRSSHRREQRQRAKAREDMDMSSCSVPPPDATKSTRARAWRLAMKETDAPEPPAEAEARKWPSRSVADGSDASPPKGEHVPAREKTDRCSGAVTQPNACSDRAPAEASVSRLPDAARPLQVPKAAPVAHQVPCAAPSAQQLLSCAAVPHGAASGVQVPNVAAVAHQVSGAASSGVQQVPNAATGGGAACQGTPSRGTALSTSPTDFTPSASSDSFGVVVYDLETVHDAERGVYAIKGLYECTADEQMLWKERSQIIEFAGIDVWTGARLLVRCRPEFRWCDVRSPAARQFAEDHGHDRIVQDESLVHFSQSWLTEVTPFLAKAAGRSRRLAMVAHNGDSFDHYVLEKELLRLGLGGTLPVALYKFDPIRTLKTHYGQGFGVNGRLALKALHTEHVVTPTSEQLSPHQALNDCIMLMEVLSKWRDLSVLMAAEIATCFANNDAEEAAALCQTLMLRFSVLQPPPAAPTPPPVQPPYVTPAVQTPANPSNFPPQVTPFPAPTAPYLAQPSVAAPPYPAPAAPPAAAAAVKTQAPAGGLAAVLAAERRHGQSQNQASSGDASWRPVANPPKAFGHQPQQGWWGWPTTEEASEPGARTAVHRGQYSPPAGAMWPPLFAAQAPMPAISPAPMQTPLPPPCVQWAPPTHAVSSTLPSQWGTAPLLEQRDSACGTIVVPSGTVALSQVVATGPLLVLPPNPHGGDTCANGEDARHLARPTWTSMATAQVAPVPLPQGVHAPLQQGEASQRGSQMSETARDSDSEGNGTGEAAGGQEVGNGDRGDGDDRQWHRRTRGHHRGGQRSRREYRKGEHYDAENGAQVARECGGAQSGSNRGWGRNRGYDASNHGGRESAGGKASSRPNPETEATQYTQFQ